MIQSKCNRCGCSIIRTDSRSSKRCQDCNDEVRREAKRKDAAKHYVQRQAAKAMKSYKSRPKADDAESAYAIPAMDVKPHPLYFKFISGQMR